MRKLNASSSVIKAAQWLADQKEPPATAAPILKKKLALTNVEAYAAVRLARDFRVVRRAFG